MRLIVLFLTLFTLQGCTAGLAMVAMNGFGACSPSTFKNSQNRLTQLHTIQVGESERKIVRRLGTPEKQSTIRTKWGGLARVLHFRTDVNHCRNYSKELIPIVTENGQVRGVGIAYYDAIKVMQYIK